MVIRKHAELWFRQAGACVCALVPGCAALCRGKHHEAAREINQCSADTKGRKIERAKPFTD